MSVSQTEVRTTPLRNEAVLRRSGALIAGERVALLGDEAVLHCSRALIGGERAGFREVDEDKSDEVEDACWVWALDESEANNDLPREINTSLLAEDFRCFRLFSASAGLWVKSNGDRGRFLAPASSGDAKMETKSLVWSWRSKLSLSDGALSAE